jgi:3-(3-hydroxy-phenyl)propionate hydroxylase
VLSLADRDDLPFARRLVNSGRLSTPCSYAGMPHLSADDTGLPPALAPGAPCLDAPLPDGGWLLERLGGGFRLLGVGVDPPRTAGVEAIRVEAEGLVGERYGRGLYLIRPDQHVAARWAGPAAADVEGALASALGGTA